MNPIFITDNIDEAISDDMPSVDNIFLDDNMLAATPSISLIPLSKTLYSND